MLDINSILAWLGGTIAVLSAIGVAIALSKGSYTKARVEALDSDNDELRKRINDLRDTVADMENQHQRDELEKHNLSERVSHVENENSLLKQLVTQRADVEAVKDVLEVHHTAAMQGIEDIKTEIKKIQPRKSP